MTSLFFTLSSNFLRRITSVASSGHEEIQWKLGADPFLARLVINLSRRRRKLDTHTGVVLEKGDLFLVFSSTTLSCEQLSEFVKLLRLDQSSFPPVGEFRLAIEEDLRFVTYNDESRPPDGLVVELAPRQVTVSADDTIDVSAFFQPASLHDRLRSEERRVGKEGRSRWA